jgi:ubiquinone/menaquinone biosynthesis C-methylase UbiE
MKKIFSKYHEKWAKEKINFFLSNIHLPHNSSILDLGGNNGTFMERFKNYFKDNYKIIIADIDERALLLASQKGYKTQYIDGGKDKFPFEDGSIDCIFCNSVIEHVTVPKDEVWETNNNFKERSLVTQKNFADEIRRCAKSYYVQTPHRHFPIEAHTWFPFIAFLPRFMQIKLIRLLNKYWFKKTRPDWNLLDEKQMKELFPDAKIIVNRKMGFKKEIIALKPFDQ